MAWKTTDFLKTIGESILDLLYPPLCLHCDSLLQYKESLLCHHCLSLMTLIEPQERCPTCFSSAITPPATTCCNACQKNPPQTTQIAASFDYEGPAATMVKMMKYGGQSYLANGAAGYLAAQFVRLEWPMPDLIIPMPMPILRRLERGYNQSLLLAQAFGKLIDRPVANILKRRSGDFSQAGLNHQQRLQLRREAFSLKKEIKLYDKNLLLIDDVMTTGKSVGCCAEVLWETYPAGIYALTLCRTQD